MKWSRDQDERGRERWTSTSFRYDGTRPLDWRISRCGRRQWTLVTSTPDLLDDYARKIRFESLADARWFVEAKEAADQRNSATATSPAGEPKDE